MFLAVGALPVIIVDSQVKPGTYIVTKVTSPRALAVNWAAKMCALLAGLCVLPATAHNTAARHAVYSCMLYTIIGLVMDSTAFVAAAVFGLTLAPHFNKPFLATSAADFWARRWNLVAGAMLRDLVYAPIVEGCMLPRPPPAPLAEIEGFKDCVGYADRESLGGKARRRGKETTSLTPPMIGHRPLNWRPRSNENPSPTSARRRFAAAMACFAVSGLAHEFILWYMGGRKTAPTWEWMGYFTLQAPLVSAEKWLSRAARRHRRPGRGYLPKMLPASIAIVVTLGVQFGLAHILFFPPVVRMGLDRRVVQDLGRYMSSVYSLYPKTGAAQSCKTIF